ncbi:hypothetical protein SAMN05421858_5095 [Haladaptatus litoreus]|uniref:Uncharacterized protein n=1 Tax=Haladaptatus litoreus TaxID=553468 RepID=A0A1N7FIG2_9EURY|nr:hypothetical protein [Haladaptatus litoreus]SIS00101.1 hypothetical protein SAMN05421858_5095 [Haladaptatus litoreus]
MSTTETTLTDLFDAQTDDEDDDCDCDDLGELPCWNCVHTGKKTLEA